MFVPTRINAPLPPVNRHNSEAESRARQADAPSRRRWARVAAVFLIVALAAALAQLLQRRCAEGREIPVLMYHGVEEEPGKDVWTVSTAEFRAQMQSLRDRGYTSILPEDIGRLRRGWGFLPRKPVVITFDDGFQNNHTVAEPILREFGMKAICYLILGHIKDTDAERTSYRGHPNLTWEEVREMQKAGTFAFGIHSISHTADPVAQAAEAQPARHVFRAKAGTRTRSYCYPFGGSSEPIREAVARKGRYTTAMVCDDRLFVYDSRSDLYRIPRISVFGGTHAFEMERDAASNSVLVSCQGNRLKALPALRDADGALHFPAEPASTIGRTPVRFTWLDLPGDRFRAAELALYDATGTVEYARWNTGDSDHDPASSR